MFDSTYVDLGKAIVDWMDISGPIMHKSNWKNALQVDNVDAWDALRSPLYIYFLGLARAKTYPVSSSEITFTQTIRSSLLWLQKKLNTRENLRSITASMLSQPYSQATILFWPCEPTHVRVQVAVASALIQMGVGVRFIASRPEIVKEIHRAGLSCTFTENYWKEAVEQAQKLAKTKLRLLKEPLGLELPPFPILCDSRHLVDTIRNTIGQLLPAVCRSVAIMNSLMQNHKPDVLVVGNDLTVEGRSACLHTRISNITTVSLMHGNIIGPLHRYHIVDRFFTFGSGDREILLENKIPETRVVVTGAPHLDSRPRQTGQVNSKIRAKLKLRGQSLVLLASSGPRNSISHSHHLTSIKNVMRLSIALPDVTFVAKLHRKDHIDYYEQARKEMPNERLIVVKYNERGYPREIFDWLQGVSIVLTGASTVAIEAMLMEIPVVTMDFADELQTIPFIQKGATYHVKTYEALEENVRDLLDVNHRQKDISSQVNLVLTELYGKLDGQASFNAAQAILNLRNRQLK